MLIVFCEECGKKYTVDPNKIKGEKANFKCTSCGNIIIVKKPDTLMEKDSTETSGSLSSEKVDTLSHEDSEPSGRHENRIPATASSLKKYSYGLRRRMIVVCIFVPVFLAFVSGFFYLFQLRKIESSVTATKIRNDHHIKKDGDLVAALGECQRQAIDSIEQIKRVFTVIWAFSMLSIIGTVSFYCYRLTERIRYLAETAERISLGELDAQIDLRSNDEIGKLGESLNRLRDSVYLALERLRR
jgi:HAMP domain-containing protein/DNA-directed RNA polymerase subunit RPC12/RpoP